MDITLHATASVVIMALGVILASLASALAVLCIIGGLAYSSGRNAGLVEGYDGDRDDDEINSDKCGN